MRLWLLYIIWQLACWDGLNPELVGDQALLDDWWLKAVQ